MDARIVRRYRLAIVLGLLLPVPVLAQPTTTQVSVGPGGVGGIFPSGNPAISADGRWVAFESDASNLVAGDTNGRGDAFVYDQQTGTTARVSLGTAGNEGNDRSVDPALSADGRWVAFASGASNLVAGDTNRAGDIFVHDRDTGTTTTVSVDLGGTQGNADSFGPAISANGRWVAFSSNASNLVAGDTNGTADVFVHDRQTGMTTRVSVGAGGAQGDSHSYFSVAMSDDGRWVAFNSMAPNLVAGDTNAGFDVFVHDQQNSTTARVNVGPGGAQADWSGGPLWLAISGDGRWVAFSSGVSNLVAGDTNDRADVFVHDRQTATTTRVSVGPGSAQGNGDSWRPAISGDGRWTSFMSHSSNLVPGDTNGRADVFVYDGHTGTTARVSLGPAGAEGNGHSAVSAISADGRWVVFDSEASNLVAGDTNSTMDVFVHDRVDPNCVATLSPRSATASAAGAMDTVQVVMPAMCAWTAVSNDPAWLTVTGAASGTGIGMVSYSVAANAGVPRTGSLSIWGQLFPVHQDSPTTPEPPIGLVASAIRGNLVTLRWTVPPLGPVPAGFVLEGGVTPGQVLASIPTGLTAPTFTFTAPTGSYFVRVHALNGPHRSAASNEIPIHVNVPVWPSAPANLLGLVDGSTLALAWTNTYTGGAPTSLELYVTGAITTSVPLGLTDSFNFAGVPPGTYTFEVFTRNSAGVSWSNPVTLTFPGPCSGAPDAPVNVFAYAVGRAVFVDWSPAVAGRAPTSYVLNVTGAFVGSFPTATRALSGTVGPGSYTLSVAAVNACGQSPGSAPQTVVVP